MQCLLRINADPCSLEGARRRLRRLDPPWPHRIEGGKRRLGRERERVRLLAGAAPDAPKIAGAPPRRSPPSRQGRQNSIAQKRKVLGITEESVRQIRNGRISIRISRVPGFVLEKTPVVADRSHVPTGATRKSGVGQQAEFFVVIRHGLKRDYRLVQPRMKMRTEKLRSAHVMRRARIAAASSRWSQDRSPSVGIIFHATLFALAPATCVAGNFAGTPIAIGGEHG